MIYILFFLALLQPTDPHLTAYWRTPSSAVISWRQTERACLYRNSTFVGCWDAPGEYRMTLGGPLTDGAYRPAAHDVYTLIYGGQAWRAELRGVVYVPVVQRSP